MFNLINAGGREVFENDPDYYEDLHDKFTKISHSQKAKSLMLKYKIGELDTAGCQPV